MRKLPHAAAVLLAALLATPTATSQDTRPAQPFDVHGVVRQSHGLTDTDGRLLAVGGGVEASFETGRVVVTPLLGSDAPTNMPMTLQLEGILRGDETRVSVSGDAEPRRRTDQVDYRHGQGIVERYVARADGIKQSVLLERPVDGRGDLVVRLRVTTELHCAVTDHARQLDFDAGALGGVHIGGVVGIDAGGARVEGSMRFDGEHLDLVLPAAFVDGARYPLDVDPVLGGRINAGRSFSDDEIDVAYDLTNDVYGVVYQSVASATDKDIYLQYVSGAGQRQGGAIQIVANGHRSELPKIASCNAADQFLVVWQDNGSGTFDVKCRAVDVLTGTPLPPVDIAATALEETSPDVGGDSSPMVASPQCVVVWDEGMAINSCVVQLAPASSTVTNVQQLLGGAPIDNPAISRDGGTAGRYFVVFQAAPNAVDVLPIDSTGTLAGGPVSVVTGSSTLYSRPDIDGNGNHFMVVMEELEQGSMSDHDIRASHGVWTGSLQLVDTVLIESDPGIDERRPCVALMHSKYVAAWADDNAGGWTDIEATNLGIDSAARCGSEVVIAGNASRAMTNPAIVSRRSGGDLGSDLGLLANREEDLNNGNALLSARLYTTFGGGPVTSLTGTGTCGNGATAGVGAPAGVGNQNFSITLSGADPNASVAILVLNVSLQAPVPFCGTGCGGILVPQFTAQRTPTGGAAELPVPIPCLANLSGASMYAQWLVLGGPVAGSCNLVAGLRSSDAIQITFGD